VALQLTADLNCRDLLICMTTIFCPQIWWISLHFKRIFKDISKRSSLFVLEEINTTIIFCYFLASKFYDLYIFRVCQHPRLKCGKKYQCERNVAVTINCREALPPWRFGVNGGGDFLCFEEFHNMCEIQKRGGIGRTINIWKGVVAVMPSVRDGTKKAFCHKSLCSTMCTKFKGTQIPKFLMSQLSSKFAITISLYSLENTGTHISNPIQKVEFHGASSGSILSLNSPRNSSQSNTQKYSFKIGLILKKVTCLIDFWCST